MFRKPASNTFSCVYNTLFLYAYLCTFTLLRSEGILHNWYIFCFLKCVPKWAVLSKWIKNLHINFYFQNSYITYVKLYSEYVTHILNLVIESTKLERLHLIKASIVYLLWETRVVFKPTITNSEGLFCYGEGNKTHGF